MNLYTLYDIAVITIYLQLCTFPLSEKVSVGTCKNAKLHVIYATTYLQFKTRQKQ